MFVESVVAEVSSMGRRSAKTMADRFVAASQQWTEFALREAMPDFYMWCLIGQRLGMGPDQFKPASDDPDATTDPEFAYGNSVTFADGSVAVRDLDELENGGTADWRVLRALTRGLITRLKTGMGGL
jgi:hypothetical protein